ncbi:hypothetical protein [Chlamydiifrater volucris]|uniref:hypothetical protein n=1 Tax=Chlamydiifrater volucris TaxID=2681470 RepID=UPI001BD077D6|nr:hypothetical protein [Chlamydiifrater volucris]
MVNPISPSDEPEPILGPDLSELSEAQNQNLAGIGKSSSFRNTEEVTSGAFDTLNRISGARAALNALLDKLSAASGESRKVAPSLLAEASGTEGPSGVEETPTQEELVQQFNTCYQSAIDSFNSFKASTTVNDSQAQLNTLLTKFSEAKRIAGQITENSDIQRQLSEIQNFSVTAQSMMNYITKMDEIASKTEALVDQVRNATTIDIANNAVVDASLNSAAASQIITDSAKLGLGDNVPPVLGEEKKRVDTAASQVAALSEHIQAAADAVKEAETILRETQANASPSKISSSIDKVTKLKEKVSALGDSSPAVQDALKRIDNVLASLEELQSHFDDIVSGIVTGGSSSSVGSSQNKSRSIGQTRVGFLLDAAESQTASIIMDGFRKMIDLFHQDNPDVRPTLRGVIDKLSEAEKAATKDPAFSSLDKSGAIDAMKVAMAKSATAEAQAAAMGAIAQAAAAMGGASPIQAAQIGSSLAAISSVSSSKTASALSTSYEAFLQLNQDYSSISQEAQQLIDSSASRSLERPLMDDRSRRDAEQSLGRLSDTNSRMTRDMLSYTKNAGVLFGALSTYESLAQMVKENPNANLEEIRKKLTTEVSKAPKYDYPYMQLPKEGAQKFIQGLTKDFVEGTKQDLEKTINEFRSQPMFVQQFLINVASFMVSNR